MTPTHVPARPASPRGQFLATVVRNDRLCREHYALALRVQGFPPTAPGQFIQLRCHDPVRDHVDDREIDWSDDAPPRLGHAYVGGPASMLRRPFSLAGRRDRPDGSAELQVIHRVVGVGTAELEHLRVGDTVDLIGPLGNVFTLPPPGGIGLLVGGGVGIPPMLYLAEAIAKDLADASIARPRKGVAFFGATTRDLLALTITDDAPPPGPGGVDPLYNVRELQPSNVPAVITTDDGSYGFRGLVTHALEQYLDRWITDNADRNRTVIYTCGPEGMMKAVAAIALRRGIACQVAVERAMACGMGTCQSCVIRVNAPKSPDGWRYALACTDGPVFGAEELLW
jgi:dihydroorotate dehydrogenase electron transfer subunit